MAYIWLNKKKYPDVQVCLRNINDGTEEERRNAEYCVAQFFKSKNFEKELSSVNIRVSADTFFHLSVNGSDPVFGPVTSGGDFLCVAEAPKHYFNSFTFGVSGNELDIEAYVRMNPEVLTDYNRGHGSFSADVTAVFSDGTEYMFSTDESWLSRRDFSYCAERTFIQKAPDEWTESDVVEGLPEAFEAPIPNLSYHNVFEKTYCLEAGESVKETNALDMIYGIYPWVESTGKCSVGIETYELIGQPIMKEQICFEKEGEYYSFRMHSAGSADITVRNEGNEKISVRIRFIATWYPVEKSGSFRCSDEGFNKVYNVCKHTLTICRQTLHLDSTKHQELLACTGDYYIESLISIYAFGDVRLGKFDVMRTSDWLVKNKGRMFHTTYSLIWVQMLYDLYMVSGDRELLEYSEPGLNALLARFETYMGDSGVIECPPDFMFVDWTVIDGYSMHHPPKALGQTVLNAFYYEAINKAVLIYDILGEKAQADKYREKSVKFFDDFNREFYDKDKKLYFDGKNDVFGGENHWIPENSPKRYFSKYPNILAVLYGLTDFKNSKEIIERIVFNDDMQDIQPYFMHYMLGAVRKAGLFGKYGMKLMDRWKKVVDDCDKGLAEGWIAPEPNYSFDHSHAWGGTVSYFLPSAVTGMKILEPGMKKLSFSPELYGLEYADVTIPVHDGEIQIKLRKDKAPEIINTSDAVIE